MVTLPCDCPLTTEVLDGSHRSQEEEEEDISGQGPRGVRQEQAWERQTTFHRLSINAKAQEEKVLTLSDDQAEGEEQVENKVEWCQSQQDLEEHGQQLDVELRRFCITLLLDLVACKKDTTLDDPPESAKQSLLIL